MFKPLDGIFVLDFSQVFAGPLCAQSLGDLGAEVIKVEPPNKGDDSRGWPPFREGIGATYLSANRNKKSLALDLKHPEGLAAAHRIAARADIVIESYTTGVAERLKIDYATLKPLNDRLIYCSLSGFGRSGPMRSYKGYDLMLQAFSGIMSITGDEEGPPTRIPFSPIDQATGQNALVGVLAALLERARTGRGCFFEVSLFETAIALLRVPMQNFWETGVQPARSRIRQPAITPYQAFDAADGSLLIGIANEKLWESFCAAVGRKELLHDPRFRRNSDRVDNYEETIAVMNDIVSRKTVVEWEGILSAIGVPHSRINSFSQVLEHEHTMARELLVDFEHPVLGPLKSIGQPIQFNGEKRAFGMPPPLLGEHTCSVLSDFGYDAAEIRSLLDRGIVART